MESLHEIHFARWGHEPRWSAELLLGANLLYSNGPSRSSALRFMENALVMLWLGAAIAAQAAASDWEPGTGFRSAPLSAFAGNSAGFTSMPRTQTGVPFTNRLAEERSLTNHILLNGSGVAAGDVDGDGWCDLYLCGLDVPNGLYRNLGQWRFEDITAAAGVACEGQDSTGAALADLDGDGDLDLLVNSVGGGTRCFLNDGRARFREITTEAGLRSNSGASSLALADIDGDGLLDLYVVNYRATTMRDSFQMQIRVGSAGGRRVVTRVNNRPATDPEFAGRFSFDDSGGLVENGEADVLYRNAGAARFTAIPFTNGAFLDEDGSALAAPPYDWGLAAAFRDLNGDGAPDLYVCNDFASPDRLWMNSGNGRFRAARRMALRKTPWFSMGVDFADINRDGWDDFFVADMLSRDHVRRHTQENDHRSTLLPSGAVELRPQYARSMVFLNRGDGDFAEVACRAGLEATDWSWSPLFLDVDLDGLEDLLVTTGFERDVQDRDVAMQLERERRQQGLSEAAALRARRAFPRLAQPNLAFRNHGNLRFEEIGQRWGFDFHGVSQAAALADLDNDGDLDVVINNLNDPVSLLRNDATAPRLAVRLRGRAPNTRGIGARITVTHKTVTGGVGSASHLPVQSQEIICGGRYLASDDPMRVFAAGHQTNQFLIEVAWRGGARSRIEARANRLYEIEEPAAVTNAPPSPTNAPPAPPLFEDVSAMIAHRHHENEFDDFARQTLLPRRLGRAGPGIAWMDVNADGWDDLVIGSGQGGALAVFQNDGHGQLQRANRPPFTEIVSRDQTAPLGWTDARGTTSVLVATSNFEDGKTNGSSVRLYRAPAPASEEMLPGGPLATGPLALADLDGSGTLSLLVGGRSLAGRYPEDADSLLFRRTESGWTFDRTNSARLERLGLVSGAVFTDLTGDGLPELVVACEWGPLKIFRNDRGQLTAWNPRVQTPESQLSTLNEFTGWWNGVTAADVNEDGRLDLIASNWGRNSKYESHRAQPLRLYSGDFDSDGRWQVIEAYADPSGKIVPWATWDRMGDSLLTVRTQFQSFRAYAQASVPELLGSGLAGAQERRVTWLDSTVFLNRGDHFEARPLPLEAQLAPAFAVAAGDLDGDGHEDLFLSQNFFSSDERTPRDDAGRGLCLGGDGRGDFTPWPASHSGVRAYGEQRGAALGDFNRDGRVDLALGQNGAETRLFRNVGAKPGVRVRLAGPAGNPHGIGATLRWANPQPTGPLREIHAGSGYLSQDSPVTVLADLAAPRQLWLRWPGGRVHQVIVPADVREISIDSEGRLARVSETSFRAEHVP